MKLVGMKRNISLIILIIIYFRTFPQAIHTDQGYTTTLPVLYLNPNAQTGGMGEIGTVSSTIYTDAGLTQNPALLSRNQKTVGIKTNLSVWTDYSPDSYLGFLGLYYSPDSLNTFGYSFDYFHLGKVHLDNYSLISRPYECYHSLRFAHSFSQRLSAGAGVKLIKSDLAPGLKPAFNTFSVDLGIDYRKHYYLTEQSSVRWDIGLSVSDIGPKVNYSAKESKKSCNIPIAAAAGTMLSYKYRISSLSSFHFDLAYQIEHILVPTPDIYFNSDGWAREIQKGYQSTVTPVEGYFGSFLPVSESDEVQPVEFRHNFGAEAGITINKVFMLAVRGGELHEFETKGGAEYYTTGFGIGLFDFRFDYSGVLINDQITSAFSVSYAKQLAAGSRQ
ncbi:MAG: PorV/PorQ family protein [Bacteroidetes bacterium]|nr:PorV/PorQ family protein [Bacteroidota bacterium]